MASVFKQKCPSCDEAILIKDRKQIGKKIDCPNCKFRLVVEDPEPVAEDVEVVEVVEDGPKPAAPTKPGAAPTKKPGPAPAGAKGAPATKPPGKPAKKPAADEDGEEKPRKKRKKDSASVVLVAGIAVAVCALGLLGVAGYFVFLSDGSGKSQGRNTGRRPDPSGETKPTTEPDTTPDPGPRQVEPTNLLPNDSEGVVHLHVNQLHRSLIGRAAFETPGAFPPRYVEERLGLKIDEVDDLLLAESFSKQWSFCVLRTRKPVESAVLKEKLALTPAAGGSVKGQEYFATPPTAWLENLNRVVAEGYAREKPAAPPTPRPLYLRIVDPQTLVLADLVPMKAFLDTQGRPKELTKPEEAPNPRGGAQAADQISKRYLTVPTPLKKVLDRVEAGASPPLCSLAWDQASLRGVLAKGDKLLPGKGGNDWLANLNQADALGLSIGVGEKIVLTLATDSMGSELNRLFRETVQPELGKVLAGTGAAVSINGTSVTPAGKDDKQRARFNLALEMEQKNVTLVVELQLPGERVNQFLLEQVFQPEMVRLRGMTSMIAEPKTPFDLADAMKEASLKNKAFPRGTVERKGLNFGRQFPPDQRLSWVTGMLPFLGYDDVARRLSLDRGWRPEQEGNTLIDNNARMGAVLIPQLIDPTAPASSWWVNMPSVPNRNYAATHYVGLAGIGLDAAEYPVGDAQYAKRLGIFGYNRETRLEDVKDGLENTILMIQVPPTYKRPWIAGGGATIQGVPETKSVSPFVSTTRDGRKGTVALMTDGSVRFIAAEIPDEAFKGLTTIAGGEKIELDKDAPPLPKPGK
ncbi:MAG: DUF1559 domain-containing protein [Planctomycetia bacterium]|nr:DUF1559 domain-containing protein [Planctomycetia bacterium]